jgi:hypothetical protein
MQAPRTAPCSRLVGRRAWLLLRPSRRPCTVKESTAEPELVVERVAETGASRKGISKVIHCTGRQGRKPSPCKAKRAPCTATHAGVHQGAGPQAGGPCHRGPLDSLRDQVCVLQPALVRHCCPEAPPLFLRPDIHRHRLRLRGLLRWHVRTPGSSRSSMQGQQVLSHPQPSNLPPQPF